MAEEEYLSVHDALKIVIDGVEVLPAIEVPLLDALQYILAEPIKAPHDLPPFPNSSMDGYAVFSADLNLAAPDHPVVLKVVADIAAGDGAQLNIMPGTAARITTGAPMPQGADAVVPVEDTNEPWRDRTRLLPEKVDIHRSINAGDYVRWSGEDIRAGSIVLDAGHMIRPQEIGLLASLGFNRIPVIRRPRVGILATGDELVDIGDPLSPGKIRNSNSPTQAAQVSLANAEPVMLGVAGDTDASVRSLLRRALGEGVDLLVSSAGVSVGAYDVVKSVLEESGQIKFWRVRMRPGKPLTFGYYQGIPYLGLPGNPVSAMVSFERFARPAILKMAGQKNLDRPVIEVIIKEQILSDGRESYIRALVQREADGYWANTTGGQGSHMFSSLVNANALVVIPEGVTLVEAGTRLNALMVDWPATVF